MNMSPLLWMITVVMTVVVLSFLLLPVVQKKKPLNVTVLATAFAVPLLAIVLYLALGRPDATSNSSAPRPDDQSNEVNSRSTPGNLASVDSLLAGLEEKLNANPADAKGWILLAKSYSHLGRSDDAVAAYATAEELGLSDAEFAAELDGTKSAIAESPVIRGRLTITDIARGRLDPQDSIFVFAKSTDGSAMPVAVLRKTASDLPFDFELSDKQAMSPSANLSGTSVVTITARVSKSGNAMQAEPGLEVVSPPINVGEEILVELQLGTTKSPDENLREMN